MAYLKDISAILGLSISTVSKALKGYPDISEETRQKVLKTAEEIDYHYGDRGESGGKRGGKRGAARLSGAFGVAMPEMGKIVKYGYCKKMIAGMIEAAAEYRKDLVFMGADDSVNRMSWSGRAARRKLDGICILAQKEDFYYGKFADLLEKGLPVVSIEHEAAERVTVCCDWRRNIYMLLAHLKRLGHRRIAFKVDLRPEWARLAAICRSEAEKLDMSCIEVETDTLMSIESSGDISRLGATCAVFKSYREAEEYIRSWRRIGWNVPEDISVVSLEEPYDGNGRGDIVCVGFCPQKIGYEAIRRLIGIAEHPETDSGERVYVCGELLGGDSVRKIAERTPENIEGARKKDEKEDIADINERKLDW